MTEQQRNLSTAIDPDQARPASGGRGQSGFAVAGRAGSAADRARRGAAIGAQNRRARLQSRRRAGHADSRPTRRLTLARYRYGHGEGFDRAAGWLYRGNGEGVCRQHRAACHCRRQSDAARRAKTPRRSRAPARPTRSPTSRRWKKSSTSISTGISSPIRPFLGEAGLPRRRQDVAVAKLADAIFAASRVDREDPVPPGNSTMLRCAAAPNG